MINIFTSEDNSFTINGVQYPLNAVALDIPDSNTSFCGIITADLQRPICILTNYANYTLDGVTAASRQDIIDFYETYMVCGSGGGGAPSGPAGGDLAGTYPNPTLNATQVNTVIVFSTERPNGVSGLFTFTIPSGYTKVKSVTAHCTSETPNNVEQFVITDSSISGTTLNVYSWTMAGTAPQEFYQITATIAP